jgi:hypothetical protein
MFLGRCKSPMAAVGSATAENLKQARSVTMPGLVAAIDGHGSGHACEFECPSHRAGRRRSEHGTRRPTRAGHGRGAAVLGGPELSGYGPGWDRTSPSLGVPT